MISVLFDVHAWIGEHKRHLGGLSLGKYVQHVRFLSWIRV